MNQKSIRQLADKNQKGSFMIESIVATTLVVVGLIGIVGLLIRSVGLNQVSYNRFIAANLAAEGIEVVKNIIDANIAQNRSWSDNINNGYYKLSHDCAVLNEGSNRCASIGGLGENFEIVMQRPPFFLIDSGGIYNYLNGTSTVFKRLMKVENISAIEIRVNAFIRWYDRGVPSTLNVEDHFFDWRS